MNIKKGDRVEHAGRGKGYFLGSGSFEGEMVVEFDQESDAEGQTLTVSSVFVEKIEG